MMRWVGLGEEGKFQTFGSLESGGSTDQASVGGLVNWLVSSISDEVTPELRSWIAPTNGWIFRAEVPIRITKEGGRGTSLEVQFSASPGFGLSWFESNYVGR